MSTKIQLMIATVILLLLIEGCSFGDKIADEINKHFPPVTLDEARAESLINNANILSRVNSTDVRVWVNESLVNEQLSNYSGLKDKGIESISVSFENQMPAVRINFKNRFKITKDMSIDVEGYMNGYFGLEIKITNISGKRVGELSFKPHIGSLRINSAKMDEKYELEKLVNKITSLLETYRDNISGELGKRVDSIYFPVTLNEVFDPNSAINHDGSALRIEGNKTKINVELESVAYLVDGGNIDILLDLDGENVSIKTESTPENINFSTYRNFYHKYTKQFKGAEISDRAGIILSGNYLFRKFNQAINSANVVVVGHYKSAGGHPFSEKIGLPSENSINCTPTRNCSADHINCTPTRDCTATKDCGGYKWYQAPDKLRCEAEKSAAKLDCERIKSINKGKCEIEKSAWKLNCERIKSQQKGLCETKKEIVKRINRTGNFANVKGTVNVEAQAALVIKSLSFSRDTVKSKVELEATARFITDIHFTPLDIIGHMACQVPWREKFSTTANITKQELDVTVNYSIKDENSQLSLAAKIAPLTITGTANPSPKSLIMGSQEFTIHCLPLAGLIRVVDIALPDVIPDEVNGEITIQHEEMSIVQPIGPIEFKQGKVIHNVRIEANNNYIAVTVK